MSISVHRALHIDRLTTASRGRTSSICSFRTQGPGLDAHLPKAADGVQAGVEPRSGLESIASLPHPAAQ